MELLEVERENQNKTNKRITKNIEDQNSWNMSTVDWFGNCPKI